METPIGNVPAPGAITLAALDSVSPADMEILLTVDADDWRAEVPLIRDHYAKFGDRTPTALLDEVDALEKRLAG